MPRTAEQIIADIKIVADEHESRLSSLIDEAETMLLSPTLAVERRIARRLQGLLPQFTQGKVGEDFRILNNSENVDLAARIYSVVQSDLQPFSDEATKWAIDSLSDAYTMGVKATVDEYNAGAEEDMGFTFGEQDAMVMEVALTKGYGKEQRGIGKIKDITQETANSIRDIMLRGIYEQKTTTQLMSDLYSPDVGLTSLEIFDSKGRKRTLSVRQRAKLIAQNEIAAIYQVAAVEKARDIFDSDPFWYYGSVYEPSTMTDWCKKRFGRIAKLSEWNDADWVRSQFNDSKTGTGHIHVNCRQSGYAVSPEWFTKTDWTKFAGNGKPPQH
ncbi:hypothetical protein H8E77_13130, partial [bacterium]|nr:hypothetical protein [bacterium]